MSRSNVLLSVIFSLVSTIAFGTSVKIEWEAVPGAKVYELQLHRENHSWQKILVPQSTTSWTLSLPPGRYRYKVRAIDASIHGPWSAEQILDVPEESSVKRMAFVFSYDPLALSYEVSAPSHQLSNGTASLAANGFSLLAKYSPPEKINARAELEAQFLSFNGLSLERWNGELTAGLSLHPSGSWEIEPRVGLFERQFFFALPDVNSAVALPQLLGQVGALGPGVSIELRKPLSRVWLSALTVDFFVPVFALGSAEGSSLSVDKSLLNGRIDLAVEYTLAEAWRLRGAIGYERNQIAITPSGQPQPDSVTLGGVYGQFGGSYLF